MVRIVQTLRTYRLTILMLTLTATTTLVALSGLVTVYGVGNGATNSGIVVGTETHNVGFEWSGTTGFFVDNN